MFQLILIRVVKKGLMYLSTTTKFKTKLISAKPVHFLRFIAMNLNTSLLLEFWNQFLINFKAIFRQNHFIFLHKGVLEVRVRRQSS